LNFDLGQFDMDSLSLNSKLAFNSSGLGSLLVFV